MANRRAYKSDESFLEKISMGATGTRAVFNDLKKQGHSPIELERGSMSFKIWKNIKVKRIRVPDIFCVRCGRSIECRSKTKLEISMSHSTKDPERKWDYGLDNDDRVAFLVCSKSGDKPIDWEVNSPIHYVLVENLRSTYEKNLTILTKPKGAEEGFEVRVIWPTSLANYPGVITAIEKSRLQYKRLSDERTITVQLIKQGVPLTPLVKEGEKVVPNQIIASVVPVTTSFPCDKIVSEKYYIELLTSSSLSKRYTAAKALAFFSSPQATNALINKVKDPHEHIYVQLEAAASLARQENDLGYEFIQNCLHDDYLQHRLEAIIVLGEIKSDIATQVLTKTLLDKDQDPEIRAGAAWALGEQCNKKAIDALIESFTAIEENIRIEAARALAKLARKFMHEVIEKFPESDPSKRPGISWALSKAGNFNITDIANLLIDEDARHWVSYIIGTQNPQKFIGEIETIRNKDQEVYFAVTVLWKILNSWIWNLEEY